MNIRPWIAFVLVLPLLGCGVSFTDDEVGRVRLLNASASHATLDLYAGTSSLSSGVASFDVGGYARLDADDYTFNLKAGGANAVAASVQAGLSEDEHLTLVAYTRSGALAVQPLGDDEDAPNAGVAKLRVLHTVADDVGAVDVYLVESACSGLEGLSAAALASGLSGLQSGYSEVTAAASGTRYHLCVTTAGDRSDLRLDVPVFTLTSRQVTTLVLVRGSGGVLLHGLQLDQQGSLTARLNNSARLRVAVGASGGAAVSVSANGVRLATQLAAPAVSSYKVVDAGALTLDLSVGGSAVAAGGLSLAAGADATLLVVGTAASAPVLIADDNSKSTSSTRPVKLRLVNGMTDAASTAVLTVDYDSVADGAASGMASSYATVPASAALARLEASVGSTVLCLSQDVTLNSGGVYTVFLLGDPPVATTSCTLRVDR